MALNKKDYVDFMNLRLGEYAYNKQNMFATELLPVNGLVYNTLVSHKSFYIINSVLGILLFKKLGAEGFNKISLKKFASKFLIGSFFNYNIFYRSYKNEYPFILEDKNKLEKYSNTFERISNSIVDSMFILQKDNFILTIIFLFCLPYNTKTSNDLSSRNDIDNKQIQIKENLLIEEKNNIKSVNQISEITQPQIKLNQNLSNVTTEKIKPGKFL